MAEHIFNIEGKVDFSGNESIKKLQDELEQLSKQIDGLEKSKIKIDVDDKGIKKFAGALTDVSKQAGKAGEQAGEAFSKNFQNTLQQNSSVDKYIKSTAKNLFDEFHVKDSSSRSKIVSTLQDMQQNMLKGVMAQENGDRVKMSEASAKAFEIFNHLSDIVQVSKEKYIKADTWSPVSDYMGKKKLYIPDDIISSMGKEEYKDFITNYRGYYVRKNPDKHIKIADIDNPDNELRRMFSDEEWPTNPLDQIKFVLDRLIKEKKPIENNVSRQQIENSIADIESELLTRAKNSVKAKLNNTSPSTSPTAPSSPPANKQHIVVSEGKTSKLEDELLKLGTVKDLDSKIKSKLEQSIRDSLSGEGLNINKITFSGFNDANGIEILAGRVEAYNKELHQAISLTMKFDQATGELLDSGVLKVADASGKAKLKNQENLDKRYQSLTKQIISQGKKIAELEGRMKVAPSKELETKLDIEKESLKILNNTRNGISGRVSSDVKSSAKNDLNKSKQKLDQIRKNAESIAKSQLSDANSKKQQRKAEADQLKKDKEYLRKVSELTKMQDELAKKRVSQITSSDDTKQKLDHEIEGLKQKIALKKEEVRLSKKAASQEAAQEAWKRQNDANINRQQRSSIDTKTAKQIKADASGKAGAAIQNMLSKFNHKELLDFSEATGKIGDFSGEAKKALEIYSKLKNLVNDGSLDSKKRIDTAKAYSEELNSIIKKLNSGTYDQFNSKGNFIQEIKGDLATARAELEQILLSYKGIDKSTIRWAANQKSVTYALEDVDGKMKQYRMNLEGTSDGFQLRKVDLGAESKIGKIGRLLNSSVNTSMSAVGTMIGMYADVGDLIQYATSGIQVFKDYDAALTDISYTTEGTKAQIDAMGESYVQLAKDMSSTVADSMEVAAIYANLKTTPEEVMQTVKPTLMLSNITGADAATASDQIQGILEQFDIGAEQSEHVVDVLASISSNIKQDFGIAIKNVTEGVRTAGQSAADAGLSFEQLASVIAKVSEKTRDSGSEIGNSLKTMLTRISKASVMDAEVDNETLSNASKALDEIGVKVYEADGTFRNFGTIIGELQQKWDSLTDSQQANVAFQVAATRQTNRFKVMLDAWTDSMQMANDVTNNSDGYAANLQGKYEESFNGRLQKLKSTTDAFWIDFMNHEATGEFVSFLTQAIELVTKLNDVITPLGTSFLAILGATKAKKIFSDDFDISSKIANVIANVVG